MNGTPQHNPPPLQAITLRNLLSFGPESPTVPLNTLNVLIGPNGSGKSNLIEAISLLRATPGNLRNVIVRGGGALEWVWKGKPNSTAVIDAIIANRSHPTSLRHIFAFRVRDQFFAIADERIENADPPSTVPRKSAAGILW